MKVTLTPEMGDRLKLLSDTLGQSPATIASFALSQYVAQQLAGLQAGEKVAKGFVDTLAPDVRAFLGKIMDAQEAKP